MSKRNGEGVQIDGMQEKGLELLITIIHFLNISFSIYFGHHLHFILG